MSDSNHHANALVKDTTRKRNTANVRIGKLMLLIKVLVLAASLTLAVGYFPNRSGLSKKKKNMISRSATTHSE